MPCNLGLYPDQLVAAYIRQESPNDFPQAISNILFKYYDNRFIWIIRKNEIRNGNLFWKHRDNGYTFKSQISMYKDFNYISYLQYYLSLKSKPKSIKKLIIYYELFCLETKSYWKNIIFFKNKKKQIPLYYPHCMSLNNTDSFTEYTFVLYIEILEEITRHDVSRPMKLLTMNYSDKFKWNINKIMLLKLKNNTGYKLISNNFGVCSNWFLCLEYDEPINKIRLYLYIIALPQSISSITINYSIQCMIQLGGNKSKNENSNGYGIFSYHIRKELNSYNLDLNNVNQLTFTLQSTIFKVYIANRTKAIGINHWKSVGIEYDN